jgi:hypothetical protein
MQNIFHDHTENNKKTYMIRAGIGYEVYVEVNIWNLNSWVKQFVV